MASIEEFYDADERRRSSVEVELGREWHDRYQVRYQLNWVADTGELYVLYEPVPTTWATPFGGLQVAGTRRVVEDEVQSMTVTVIGTVAGQDEVEQALDGWEQAMAGPDSLAWLLERMRSLGVGPAEPGSPLVS